MSNTEINKELEITTLEQLSRYKGGQLVELPAFAEGQPFVARMRRPSMLALIKSGKISNELLTSANSLFASGSTSMDDVADEKLLTKMFGVMSTIVNASLLEPSYQEIQEAGIELTDEQILFIFTYSQRGVKALDNFRQEQGSIEHNNNE